MNAYVLLAVQWMPLLSADVAPLTDVMWVRCLSTWIEPAVLPIIVRGLCADLVTRQGLYAPTFESAFPIGARL